MRSGQLGASAEWGAECGMRSAEWRANEWLWVAQQTTASGECRQKHAVTRRSVQTAGYTFVAR